MLLRNSTSSLSGSLRGECCVSSILSRTFKFSDCLVEFAIVLAAMRMFKRYRLEREALVGLIFSANLMSRVLLVIIFCF